MSSGYNLSDIWLKNFSSSLWVDAFYFLYSVLRSMQILSLMKSNLSVFCCFWLWWFSEKSLPKPQLQKIYSCFLLSLIVLALLHLSQCMIYFELIFVVRYGSSSFFFLMWISSCPSPICWMSSNWIENFLSSP